MREVCHKSTESSSGSDDFLHAHRIEIPADCSKIQAVITVFLLASREERAITRFILAVNNANEYVTTVFVGYRNKGFPVMLPSL